MFKIEAIIREEVFEDVREKLGAIEIQGITMYQVMGCGIQSGWTEVVRGNKIELNLLPKIKLEIVVSSKIWVDKVISVIENTARTGNMGDGKIFVSNLEQVIRIQTGETGVDALN